jgi:hypothetical protein
MRKVSRIADLPRVCVSSHPFLMATARDLAPGVGFELEACGAQELCISKKWCTKRPEPKLLETALSMYWRVETVVDPVR